MSGHTKGPWRIGYVDDLAVHAEADAGRICRADPSLLTMAQAKANARLIAAAPELLAALKETWGKLYLLRLHVLSKEVSADLSASLDSIAAAIAKAEGRS